MFDRPKKDSTANIEWRATFMSGEMREDSALLDEVIALLSAKTPLDAWPIEASQALARAIAPDIGNAEEKRAKAAGAGDEIIALGRKDPKGVADMAANTFKEYDPKRHMSRMA